jgi:hypothetical protein
METMVVAMATAIEARGLVRTPVRTDRRTRAYKVKGRGKGKGKGKMRSRRRFDFISTVKAL